MSIPGDNRHVVYVAHCNDQVLYVGMSNHLWRRLREHDGSAWMASATSIAWTVYDSRDEAAAAEIDTIHNLRPLYNKIHSDLDYAPREFDPNIDVIADEDFWRLPVRARKADVMARLRAERGQSA